MFARSGSALALGVGCFYISAAGGTVGPVVTRPSMRLRPMPDRWGSDDGDGARTAAWWMCLRRPTRRAPCFCFDEAERDRPFTHVSPWRVRSVVASSRSGDDEVTARAGDIEGWQERHGDGDENMKGSGQTPSHSGIRIPSISNPADWLGFLYGSYIQTFSRRRSDFYFPPQHANKTRTRVTRYSIACRSHSILRYVSSL